MTSPRSSVRSARSPAARADASSTVRRAVGGARPTADPSGPSDNGQPGILRVGTSGFAYPAWHGAFYPPDLPNRQFLSYYATRFAACELNGTFYARPSLKAIGGWLAATPENFRFVVKAQRGGALRALYATPAESVRWLTEPLPAFGDRLGAVLFRVPREARRRGREDDARLRAILDAWPRTIPLVIEMQDPSWQVDETFRALTDAEAILCATDLDTPPEPPTLRLTGPALYVRLRRATYTTEELDSWAARVAPFLAAGTDVWAFFRHDESGETTVRASVFEDAARRALDRQSVGASA
jgi:uncharacterized protein YecE (DUF72 family)